jgi:hypothetical protein
MSSSAQKYKTALYNRSQPLSFKLFPIHYLLIILSLQRVQFALLPASLNKSHIKLWDYKSSSHPEGRGSTHLWNVDLLQQDCIALYPRRLSSSQTFFLAP